MYAKMEGEQAVLITFVDGFHLLKLSKTHFELGIFLLFVKVHSVFLTSSIIAKLKKIKKFNLHCRKK